jgi:carboxyl-terminal processing protease
MNNFAFDYVDNNRKELEKWNIDTFIQSFDKDETVYNAFLIAIKMSKKPSSEEKESMKNYLNASIANLLFGDLGFYRIMQKEDKMLLKVLELESIQE